jgi:hypothetical protein
MNPGQVKVDHRNAEEIKVNIWWTIQILIIFNIGKWESI